MSPKRSAILILLVLIVPLSVFAQGESEPVRILRLDSYHAEFPWSAQILFGVMDALAENGYEVDGETVILDEFYMDTKRNTSEDYFERISEEAIEYVLETQPDIVIANDDNAARLVAYPLRNEGVRFVLLGINGTPEGYEMVGSTTIAGVLERPHINEMTAWIEQVFGAETRISILAEDSPTSERMFGDGIIQQAIEDSPLELVDVMFTSDYVEWQEYVLSADDVTDILFLGAYGTLRDADDEAVEPVDVLAWTVTNSPIPVMGFWEEAVHDGTLGGPVISGYNQGYEAAVRATQILDGTPVEEIGFSVPPRGLLIISRDAMERWNVNVPLSLLEVSEIVEQ